MFLGVDQLLDLVNTQHLVEGLSQRELNNPEGAGFDLQLEEVFKIKGNGFLGITERKTCDIESVAKLGQDKHILIKPNDFYLVKTVETVNLPNNLVGILKPRSTLQRMGIFLRTTQISPGYSGPLTFALKNVGPCEVTIELGARIAHVLFAKVDGQTASYRGQWQGGRVSATQKEVQV